MGCCSDCDSGRKPCGGAASAPAATTLSAIKIPELGYGASGVPQNSGSFGRTGAWTALDVEVASECARYDAKIPRGMSGFEQA